MDNEAEEELDLTTLDEINETLKDFKAKAEESEEEELDLTALDEINETLKEFKAKSEESEEELAEQQQIIEFEKETEDEFRTQLIELLNQLQEQSAENNTKISELTKVVEPVSDVELNALSYYGNSAMIVLLFMVTIYFVFKLIKYVYSSLTRYI